MGARLREWAAAEIELPALIIVFYFFWVTSLGLSGFQLAAVIKST